MVHSELADTDCLQPPPKVKIENDGQCVGEERNDGPKKDMETFHGSPPHCRVRWFSLPTVFPRFLAPSTLLVTAICQAVACYMYIDGLLSLKACSDGYSTWRGENPTITHTTPSLGVIVNV